MLLKDRTLRFLSAEGKPKDPLHHLMVLGGQPYSYGRSVHAPAAHVCCFYEHVHVVVVDAWGVAHECTIVKFLQHRRIESFHVMNVGRSIACVVMTTSRTEIRKHVFCSQDIKNQIAFMPSTTALTLSSVQIFIAV